MDGITQKELLDEIASLQKRGLTRDGAIKAATKAYSAKVVLLEDGTEVAFGDIEFESAEAPIEESAEEAKAEGEDPMPADEEEEKTAKSVAKMVVADELKKTKTVKGPTVDESENGRLVIPAVAKQYRAKNFRRETIGGFDADQRAYLLGHWARTVAAKSLPNAGIDASQSEKIVKQHLAKSGQVSFDNTLGGFHVPVELSSDIITLREEYGVARRLFGNEPMSSDTKQVNKWYSGMTVTFPGEAKAGTVSKTKDSQVQLVAKKATATGMYSMELGEDSIINEGDRLAAEIAWAFSQKEDNCAFLGDGTSTYGGMQGAVTALKAAAGNPTTDSAGGVVVGAGNAWDELTLANFRKVVGVLPQYAAARAVWACSRTFYYDVMEGLILAAGGTSATEMRDGAPGRPIFLGYPVEIVQVMPTAEANSQIPVLLGDFTAGAIFGNRSGMAIKMSDSATVGGESAFETDQVAVKGIERFDINVHGVGDETTAGPIVGLQTLNA